MTRRPPRHLHTLRAPTNGSLPADVVHFNNMFLEQEEDVVIRLRSLEAQAAFLTTTADLKEVFRCGAGPSASGMHRL
jgi:hypothetical protein